MLIKQAHDEVKEYQLENKRITNSLERLSNLKMILNETETPSPFAFPLLVERLKKYIKQRINRKKSWKTNQKI